MRRQSPTCSIGSPTRPYACRYSLMLLPSTSRTDQHSNATSNSVVFFVYLYSLLWSTFLCSRFGKHYRRCTRTHLRPLQIGRFKSHEVLPTTLVLHLKCFRYDATANCIVRINKPIQFAPEHYSAACFAPKDETSSGQGKCLRRSGYTSHLDVRCCGGGQRALSDFTDRRLVKQQRRPCDGISLHGLL